MEGHGALLSPSHVRDHQGVRTETLLGVVLEKCYPPASLSLCRLPQAQILMAGANLLMAVEGRGVRPPHLHRFFAGAKRVRFPLERGVDDPHRLTEP